MYAHAGWYADLDTLMHAPGETSPDYDFADLSHALVAGETFDGKLDGIPLNIEGPIVYYRKDIFAKCHIQPPATLDGVKAAAAALHKCEPHMIAWATRGLKPALPYTFSNVLHNFGTDYMDAAGKPDLCSPKRHSGDHLVRRHAEAVRPAGRGEQQLPANARTVRPGPRRDGVRIEQRIRRDDEVPASPGRYRADAAAAGAGRGVEADGDRLGPVAVGVFEEAVGGLVFRAMGDLEGDGRQARVAGHRTAARFGGCSSADYQTWLHAAPVREDWAELLKQMGATGTSEVGPPLERQPQAREIIGEAVDSVLLGQASAHDAACSADKQIAAMMAEK